MVSSSGDAGQSLPVGARVGPYRVTGWLGRGGMGAVYEAFDDAAQRPVALKVLAPEMSQDARFVERFRREIRLAADVHHAHAVACYGAGEIQGRLWIALELVRGGSLADRVRTGPLPPLEVARLGFEIASALAALHGIGVVHRDLKPANVLVTPEGAAKLSDLGLARGEGTSALTRTGELLGTVEYMAPELADGARGADERVDLYALGCTLYCLLAGEPPFPGSGPAVIAKHIRSTPPPVLDRAKGCPPELARIVHQLLAKEPGARGGTAADVAAALARVLGRRTTVQKAFATVELDEEPPRRLGLAIVLVVVALAALVGTGLLVRSRLATVAAAPSPSPSPPTSRASPSGRPTPPPPQLPEWYRALAPAEKPDPLPPGVKPREAKGEYANLRDGSVLVYVPAGKFVMGRGGGAGSEVPVGRYADELPNVTVELSGYFLGKYEVSNDEFAKFAAATKYRTAAEEAKLSYCIRIDIEDPTSFEFDRVPGASWKKPRGKSENPPDYPVVQVSWDDANAYCAWAGLRLPSEAEWERAAAWDGERARTYPWGEENDPVDRANVIGTVPDGSREHEGLPNHLDKTHSLEKGVSPVGAYHMLGNAAEWVLDFHDPGTYAEWAALPSPVRDPCVLDRKPGHPHVLRGGSFIHAPPETRCATRSKRDGKHFKGDAQRTPIDRHDGTGFRVALSAAGTTRSWEGEVAALLRRR